MTNLDKNSTGNEKTQGFYATSHRKNRCNCLKNMIRNRKNWKLENKIEPVTGIIESAKSPNTKRYADSAGGEKVKVFGLSGEQQV